MSERIASHPSRAEDITASVIGGGGTGVLAGAAFTNAFLPPTVNLPPSGVAVEPSVAWGQSNLEVIYGSTRLDVPKIHAGVNLDITGVDVPLKGQDLEHLAALVSQFHTSVEEPIQHALFERLAVGGSIGAVVGGLVVYEVLRGLRKHSLPERIKRSPRKAAAIGVAGTLAIIGCGATSEYGEPAANKLPPTALSSTITEQAPVLEGATVSGIGGTLVKNATAAGVDYVSSVGKFWQTSAHSFNTAFAAFEKRGGNTHTGDPNVIPVLHVSDLHCNYANYKYYLSSVLRRFQAPIIINAGDTSTNSATMPYEKRCVSDVVDDVDKAAQANHIEVALVGVAGNHDDKKADNMTRGNTTVTTLTQEKNTVTVDGITFVGSEDPRITILYPTLPDNRDAQYRALAKQGHALAETACTISDKTGEAPIVLSHGPQAGYESILRGCALEAMSGHTHHNGPVKRFNGENGRTVLQHTAGSASGADVGLTIWEKPQQDASVMIQYFDKTSHEFVGATTSILHTDGTVSIRNQTTPKHGTDEAAESADMRTFVGTYAVNSK